MAWSGRSTTMLLLLMMTGRISMRRSRKLLLLGCHGRRGWGWSMSMMRWHGWSFLVRREWHC